ncbi:hypothetical protein [Anabaena sp. 4-3]|uniref:hypothetical protein n=1 Tax=Anabaena sp. 4-3 TaxID=1811979 RepID=UPI00082DC948|nr:hypothetical protein [Anabaena sp. 4-3]
MKLFTISLTSFAALGIILGTPSLAESNFTPETRSPSLQRERPRKNEANFPIVAPSQPDIDFYCGKGFVPCDQTFKDFCAKVAKGHYKVLPSGHGACITPGGHNPDPF